MRVSSDPAARRRLTLLAAVAAAALIVGIGVGAGAGGGEDGAVERPAGPAQRARAAVDRLPLASAVGQVLVSSFEGTSVPEYLRRRLRAGQSAGVILFGGNIASRAGLRRMARDLQRAANGGALVMVDQEGGDIRTVAFAGPQPSQPLQGDAASVEALARRAARSLRRDGVNVNLAPVADVPVGPTSALAGRAFAGGPDEVAERVRAAVRGLRAGRVAATVKHFPGLGAAVANTDDAAVTLDLLDGELERRDLPPFAAAIEEDVPLVMLSHALYPATDGIDIASQSEPIASRLLRDRLGFRGVAITDSMEAQAVLDRSGVAEAAERSLAAGADLILMTGSASWNEVFPRVLERAKADATFRARVREAAARVLRLKRALGLSG